MKVEEFGNGAVREDKEGKGRFDLLPWCAIMRIAKHMQESLKVYEPRNWEKGLPMHSMIDSAFRHLAKYVDGQTDEDHLCAAATNLLMAMWMEEKHPEMQDIPSRRLSDAPSLSLKREDERRPACDSESQGEPKEEALATCPGYIANKSRCLATEEIEYCNCRGDVNKCDWFSEAPYRVKQG